MTNHFDKVAEQYDTEERQHKEAQRSFEYITKYIPIKKHFHVLDIGCGTGILTLKVAEKVKALLAVDNSQGMLDILNKKIKQKNVKNIQTLHHDIVENNLPFRDFNLVFSTKTMHHIEKIDEFLKYIYSILDNEGYVCIIDLLPEDGTFHSEMHDGIKHFGFEKDFIRKTIERAGFKNISVDKIYDIKKERNNKIKKYPLFIAVGQKIINK